MGEYKIIEATPKGVGVESNCETGIAARRRLKMLEKNHPENAYWIEAPASVVPKVTVTRITPNDPTAMHIRRNA